MIEQLLTKPVRALQKSEVKIVLKFLKVDDEEDEPVYGKSKEEYFTESTIVDLLDDNKVPREDKLNEITIAFDSIFPSIEGDKVTFIGSTFLKIWRRTFESLYSIGYM